MRKRVMCAVAVMTVAVMTVAVMASRWQCFGSFDSFSRDFFGGNFGFSVSGDRNAGTCADDHGYT